MLWIVFFSRYRRRNTIAVGLLIVLAWVAASVYSPLHRHTQGSNQVCSLSHYGFAAGLEAASEIVVNPEIRSLRLRMEAEYLPYADGAIVQRLGRAPPA